MLLGRHAECAIEPDGLAIEHIVFDDMPHQSSIFRRFAQPWSDRTDPRHKRRKLTSISQFRLPGAADHLTFTSSTADLASGGGRTLVAEVRDAAGNLLTGDNSTSVDFRLGAGRRLRHRNARP